MNPENNQGHAAPSPRRGGRIAAIVAAGLVGLLSIALLAAGGLLLWGDSKKDDDGFLTTSSERFSTTTSALATEKLDLDLDGLGTIVGDDAFGDLRLRAHSQDGKPVFVGIGRTSDVERYLAGSSHEVIDDIDSDPFSYDSHTIAGERALPAPAGNSVWAASATGDGAQSLTWDVRDGNWSVVVMNADGSPGVNASVSAGASLGFLDDAGRIAITTGVVLLVIAGGLLFAGVRRPPEQMPLGRPVDPAAVAVA
jgi:hypothetical protein